MAIYTTFFLCQPDELSTGFPGWKPPLLERVWREVYDPILQENRMILTDEPDWPDQFASGTHGQTTSTLTGSGFHQLIHALFERLSVWFRPRPLFGPKFEIVQIEGYYDDYLENRLPAFVREHPHHASKNITNVEIERLGSAAGLKVELESHLYAPPNIVAFLSELPPVLLSALMAADEEQLTAIAEQFASSMSTYFVSANPAIQADNELNAIDARDFYIDPILNLARQMMPEQRLYLLIG